MEEKLKQIISDSYKKNKNYFYEKVCEEIGNWIEDYESHPDTGMRLANTGYYSNEDEIEEKCKEYFVSFFLEEELPEEYDILKEDKTLNVKIYKLL